MLLLFLDKYLCMLTYILDLYNCVGASKYDIIQYQALSMKYWHSIYFK